MEVFGILFQFRDNGLLYIAVHREDLPHNATRRMEWSRRGDVYIAELRALTGKTELRQVGRMVPEPSEWPNLSPKDGNDLTLAFDSEGFCQRIDLMAELGVSLWERG